MILSAIVAVFNFLATPAGQTLCTAMYALDSTLVTKVADLFNYLHGQLPSTTSTSTTSVSTN
jgi:hypothetical protein